MGATFKNGDNLEGVSDQCKPKYDRISFTKHINNCCAVSGEVVIYSIIIENIGDEALTKVFFKDTIPHELCFLDGTVCINGKKICDLNPNNGFYLPDIKRCSSINISFSARIKCTSHNNSVNNIAQLRYYIGDDEFTEFSNSVKLHINDKKEADIMVTKTGKVGRFNGVKVVTYIVKVGNYGPCVAKDIFIRCSLPNFLRNAMYSIDEGSSWCCWCGKYKIGELPPCTHYKIIICAVICSGYCRDIVTTAEVDLSTYDPNIENNKIVVIVDPKKPSKCK